MRPAVMSGAVQGDRQAVRPKDKVLFTPGTGAAGTHSPLPADLSAHVSRCVSEAAITSLATALFLALGPWLAGSCPGLSCLDLAVGVDVPG